MKYLFTFLITFIALTSKAQTVGYTYKPLAAEGCSMRYSISKQDTIYYIIATVESDRLKFLKESTMMIRTFDEEVIKLQNFVVGANEKDKHIVNVNFMKDFNSDNVKSSTFKLTSFTNADKTATTSLLSSSITSTNSSFIIPSLLNLFLLS